jgi:hypothetical protein
MPIMSWQDDRQGIKLDWSHILPIPILNLMEQHALKNVRNFLNTSIYSYLETSGDQSSMINLNVLHFFFNTSVD